MDVSFDISQLGKLFPRLTEVNQAIYADAAIELQNFANDTMRYIQDHMGDYYYSGRWVTGQLRDSGYVDRPKVSSSSVSIQLGFAGAVNQDGDEYALPVHEGHHLVAWGHPTNVNIPPTKFFETPLLHKIPEFERKFGTPLGVKITSHFKG